MAAARAGRPEMNGCIVRLNSPPTSTIASSSSAQAASTSLGRRIGDDA